MQCSFRVSKNVPEGVTHHRLEVYRAGKPTGEIEFPADTGGATLRVGEGDVVSHFHMPGKKLLVQYTVPAQCPPKVQLYIDPCLTIAPPPTPPSGVQHVENRVAIAQAVAVEVVKAAPEKPLDEMSAQEKLQAGYRPVNEGGQVTWQKT